MGFGALSLMKKDRFLLFVIAAFALAVQAFAQTSSSYRQQFPLPASTSVTSWAVNANFKGVLPDDSAVQSIADSGNRFVRLDLNWSRIERTAGVYNFDFYDSLMGLLKAHGLRAVLILDYTNKLYNSGMAPSTDDSRAAFVNFAAAAVTRYQGQGVLWEIWNEPNESKFWAPGSNADDYASLALLVGQAIRTIAPDEWIVGPGLSTFDWQFLQTCFQRGVLQYFDAVSVHPYRSHDIPETAIADYEQLKALIEQYRPVGKGIAIIDSEWGYSLGWVNYDPDLQAKVVLRSKLIDMLEGARLSVTYAWQDAGSDSTNNYDVFGLHDYGMVERESGQVLRQFAGRLKGYKLVTRLDLGSPDDFCLLFAAGSTTELVAWTTNATHDVSLPASAGSFTGVDILGNEFSESTAGQGLVVSLSDSPILLRPTSSNALLRTASSWGRLPASATVGDYVHLQKILTPALVSPSWRYAPVGSSLIVQDSASPDELFAMPNYEGSLTGLGSLTATAATVQQVVGATERPVDLSPSARELKVTLTMPDGSQASQVCEVLHSNPVGLTILTPQSGKLTVRVDNLAGVPFQGQLQASANGKSATQPLSLTQGDSSQILHISAISSADIQNGLQMNVSAASSPTTSASSVPSSNRVFITRLPDPAPGDYATSVEGDPTVATTAQVAVVGAPTGAGITGMKSLNVLYSFAAGKSDVALVPPTAISTALWSGAKRAGMWLFADGSKNTLLCRFVDDSGQIFQAKYGELDWTGWRYVEFPLTGAAAAFSGGAADGIVHGSVRLVDPLVIVSQGSSATTGSIYAAGITVICVTP